MELKIRINKNLILSICIAAYYAFFVLNRIQQTLFPGVSSLQMIMRVGNYLLIIVIFLNLIQSSSNIKILIILELIVAALFLISRLMDNLGDLDWITVYRRIALYFIPLALAAYNIVDRKKLLQFLYRIALIATPALIITVLLSYGNWDSSYDMSLGYVMVFTALILLADFIINIRAIDIVLAAILCLFILFAGSRGPFICIISFIVIELLFSKSISASKKIIFLSVIVILAIIVVINIDSILMLAYQISQRIGFDSRSLRLLMQGEIILHDSGRIEIWSYYMNLINQRPAFGYGVMGGWFHNGSYPHNIFLELLLSFGYPIGIILFIIVILIMAKGVRSDDKYSSAIAIAFVSFCMLLFISNTYLHIWQFFVCLALCIPRRNSALRLCKQNEN